MEQPNPTPSDHPRDDLMRRVEWDAGKVEFRASQDPDDGRLGTLQGYAAVFNTDTLIDSWEGRFYERLMPGAFRKTLEERGDKIKILFDHGMDPSIGNKPLGKPSRMEEDDYGLWVEVPLDDTSYNRDIVASLRSGALDGMSFRFSVVRDEWDTRDGAEYRTIKEVKLYEAGPVTFPAYEATTAGIRGQAAYRTWRNAHITDPDDISIRLHVVDESGQVVPFDPPTDGSSDTVTVIDGRSLTNASTASTVSLSADSGDNTPNETAPADSGSAEQARRKAEQARLIQRLEKSLVRNIQ